MGRRAPPDRAAEWDMVWAEYDARHPRPVEPARPARPVIQPARRRRPSLVVLLAVGLPLLAASGWIAASAASVRQVAEAVERHDPAALARHLDRGAVQAGLRDTLLRLAGHSEGDDAAWFLTAMAQEMADAWSDPAALAAVARARGVAPGAAVEGLRSARPVGLTAVEMPIGTTAGAATPLLLRLELRDQGGVPRWQVTQVRIGTAARDVPPAAPLIRVSELK